MVDKTAAPIGRFVILGGGTAGWIAAATLGHIFKNTEVNIELVESADVGIIGVGEATVPVFLETLHKLGIDEADFIRATQATFKWGIEFADWRQKGESYFHSFGPLGRRIDGHEFYQCWLKCRADGDSTPLTDHAPEALLARQNRFFLPFEAARTPLATARYALHLDATLVGRYLRDHALGLGVARTEGHVDQVLQRDDGFIRALQLVDGRQVSGDFFIDCSGFAGLLIEQTLTAGYDDWSGWLPCDRAVTVQSERLADLPPYTLARAQAAGWTWRIPLQHRTGNGYVYCSRAISDDEAAATLTGQLQGAPLGEPRVIPFVTGVRRRPWVNNCLALGLAQGFLEPLESTAIHLVSKTLTRFVSLLPDVRCDRLLVESFNEGVRADYEEIRDFLILHYCTSAREDSAFWRECRQLPRPESLDRRIALFAHRGILDLLHDAFFQAPSWQMVLTGMGVIPERHHPALDVLDAGRLRQSLAAGREAIARVAAEQPLHREFVAQYCPAVPL